MKKEDLAVALSGVVIGVLVSMIVFKALDRSREFDGDYNRWRKLNLILEQVQKNYVDTLDMERMTDAAVVAALSELDPHSVYLPPVDLKASETELAGNFDGIGIQFKKDFRSWKDLFRISRRKRTDILRNDSVPEK